jgi:hypothetical protein
MKQPIQPQGHNGHISYKQGSKRIRVELLENVIAVRYRAGAERSVTSALRTFGRAEIIRSQRLAVVELADEGQRARAVQRFHHWLQEGVVEFVTPVLRDSESQTLQILSDEIAVRFKSTLTSKRRRSVEQRYGITLARQNEFVPRQFIAKVPQPEGLRTLEVAGELNSAEEVEFAAPNFISEYRR